MRYIFFLLFIFMYWQGHSQSITARNRLSLRNIIENYCQNLENWAKTGDIKHRVALEDMFIDKENQVYNDVGRYAGSNPKTLNLTSYLSSIRQKRPNLKLSHDLKALKGAKVYTLRNSQGSFVIIPVTKWVNRVKTTNYFILNLDKKKINNIWSYLPSGAVLDERDEPSPPPPPDLVEMVYVQGGTFTMGCTSEQSDCYDNEKPVHRVTVSSFYMSKYEVTQKLWREVMGSDPPELRFQGCDNCPVERVSWNDIQTFIKKLNQKTGKNYRLPIEAEWEFAARGGNKSKGYKYAGSNTIDAVAWYFKNSDSKTHPVGQKRPNELGLYDMSGNVYEWCSDWYGSYSKGTQTNPIGPSSDTHRVLRGGCWGSDGEHCRFSYRSNNYPSYRSHSHGFRLVFLFKVK